jgi:hypothetical protein
LIAFVGLNTASGIALRVAAVAPKVALAIAVAGLGLAFARGRRVPIEITTVGTVLTTGGFLLLLWLST